MIKDADSLAHLDDFGLEHLNIYERLRINASDVHFVECRVSEPEFWTTCAIDHMKHLQLKWHVETFEENPNEWVHGVRIEIRKIRSIIDLMSAVCPSAELSAYSLDMKKKFSQLSEARMLYMMSVYQNKQNQFNKKKSLLEKLEKSLGRIRILIDTIEFEKLFFNGLSERTIDLREVVLKAFDTYLEACKENAVSMEQLHRLRVEGKLFKYACEHELVAFNAVSIEKGINDLHDALGTAHDLYEMLRFKHAKRYFSMGQLERDYRTALSRCKAHLFYFKLLSRKNKGDA